MPRLLEPGPDQREERGEPSAHQSSNMSDMDIMTQQHETRPHPCHLMPLTNCPPPGADMEPAHILLWKSQHEETLRSTSKPNESVFLLLRQNLTSPVSPDATDQLPTPGGWHGAWGKRDSFGFEVFRSDSSLLESTCQLSLIRTAPNKCNVPGIRCGDYCRPNYAWCRSEWSDPCETPLGPILTNDTELCGNTSFWSNKTCDIFNYDGEKIALGLRCTGGVQHCINPWYLKPFQVHNPIYKVK